MRGCVLPLFLGAVLAASGHRAAGYNPKPNPKSVVEVGGARFTMLTERLVRMEWGGTNDAATFAFINRDLLTPNFNVSKDGDYTVIKTPSLQVHVTWGRKIKKRGGAGRSSTFLSPCVMPLPPLRSATYPMARHSTLEICKYPFS